MIRAIWSAKIGLQLRGIKMSKDRKYRKMQEALILEEKLLEQKKEIKQELKIKQLSMYPSANENEETMGKITQTIGGGGKPAWHVHGVCFDGKEVKRLEELGYNVTIRINKEGTKVELHIIKPIF